MKSPCTDPACPRDFEAGASRCSRCEREAPTINLDDVATLTGQWVRPDLVLGKRFHLERKLGMGGMGEVWLARDTVLDDRLVACKILKTELAGDEGAIRDMKREVGLAQTLSHDHIIRVHDFHEKDGLRYISMAYVDGPSLKEHLDARLKAKGRGFALAKLLPALEQAAAALDYAHRRGVIHRDVKPGNMLLGSDRKLQLGDFGIARTAIDSMSRLTGQFTSGTLAYMSPEQLMGYKCTPASDQYSLAVSAYELLTGKPPFYTGDIPTQVRFREPDPLEGQPEAVNGALLKALSKEPEKRFGSCTEFVQALAGKVAIEEPPAAAPEMAAPEKIVSPMPEPRAPKGRGVKVAVALLVLSGLGFGAWYAADQGLFSPAVEVAQDTPAPEAVPVAAEATPPPPKETPPVPEPEGPDPVLLQSVAAAKTAAESARTDALAAGAEQHAAEALAAADDTLAKANAAETAKDFEKSATLFGDAQRAFEEIKKTAETAAAAKAEEEQPAAEPPATPPLEPAPVVMAPTVTIDGVNVTMDTSALAVEGTVRFTGMAGTKVEIAAYFYDATGEVLKDTDGVSRSSKGQVYVGATTEIAGDDAVVPYKLPLPLLQLERTEGGKQSLNVDVVIWSYAVKPAKEVARSPRTPFEVTLDADDVRVIAPAPVVMPDPAPRPVLVPVEPEPEPVAPTPAPSRPAPAPSGGGGLRAGTERSFEIAPGVSMAFVWIPAGTFTMGSPASEVGRDDDETQRQIRIDQGFWLGKYEVTQAEWQAVIGSNPSSFKGAKNPVEMVSWDDCQGFLRKLGGGFRLPTEAEWEYACRAGTTTPFHFGATITPDEVNYDGNYPYGNAAKGIYREKTTEIGTFPANRWGLHDMHGNVYEWCSDQYDGTSNRVLRGGSWDYPANICRSAYRNGGTPDRRYNDIGFRVVRTSV